MNSYPSYGYALALAATLSKGGRGRVRRADTPERYEMSADGRTLYKYDARGTRRRATEEERHEWMAQREKIEA